MNKRTNKKPGNKIGGRPEDSLGQNPFWPGEGAQEPGTFTNERGEKVIIPFVDSVIAPPKKD
jgi:hypothetical protein